MKKLLAGAVLIVLLGAGCAAAPTGTPPTNTNANANTNSQATAPAASIKFADQPYYKNAFLISGATMDAKTKEAITGFAISKKALPDGTTQYDLKALKSEYKDQTYVIKPGEKLYFIEAFMGDDDVNENLERGYRDDLAVVVDGNGNVENAPALWTK